jgi:hypothetical protein
MLNNPNHIGVFLGNGEKERLEIEKMFASMKNSGLPVCPSREFSVSKSLHDQRFDDMTRWST